MGHKRRPGRDVVQLGSMKRQMQKHMHVRFIYRNYALITSPAIRLIKFSTIFLELFFISRFLSINIKNTRIGNETIYGTIFLSNSFKKLLSVMTNIQNIIHISRSKSNIYVLGLLLFFLTVPINEYYQKQIYYLK